MALKVLNWQPKFHIDIHGFYQEALINITTQHKFLKFENIMKILTYISTLYTVHCHQNVALLLLNSYWFHQWPGFHKRKQVPFLLMWLWEVGRLSLEIGLVHVLDWENWMSVVSRVLFPDFQQCLFILLSVLFFLIRMLLLDLLLSRLILILRSEIFKTNSNDNLRLRPSGCRSNYPFPYLCGYWKAFSSQKALVTHWKLDKDFR